MITKAKHIQNLARIIATISVAVMLLFFASCRQNRDFIQLEFDPETVPTMVTTNGHVLISDSGITRYRIKADLWLDFDRATIPHSLFPEGFQLEVLDSLFQTEVTIVADTAWNFTTQHLWQLRGNVHIDNVNGFQFWSEELFWNEQEGVFYTEDLFFEAITEEGVELRGYGFRMGQDMSWYYIFRPHDQRFPIVENQPPARRFNESEEWDASSIHQIHESEITETNNEVNDPDHS